MFKEVGACDKSFSVTCPPRVVLWLLVYWLGRPHVNVGACECPPLMQTHQIQPRCTQKNRTTA